MSLVLAGLWTMNKNISARVRVFDGHPQCIFWPFKIWFAAGVVAGAKTILGQRHPRTWHVHGHHPRHGRRRRSCREDFRGEQWISGGILIGLAILGCVACLGITRVPAADPQKKFHANFPAATWRRLRAMRGDRPLWLAVIGNTYFNFLGALLLLNLFFYGADVLHVDETHIGLLNVALALGIGLGSFAAGYLSGGKIEYGLVPLGAFGLTICATLLALPQLSVASALGDARVAGVLRRIFHRAHRGAVAAPTVARKQGRSPGRGQSAFVRRRVPRVRRALAAGTASCNYLRAPFFSWAAC